jgi:hypothetical protein
MISDLENGLNCELIASGYDGLGRLADAEQHIKLLTGFSDAPVWFRTFDDTGKDVSKPSKFFGTVADQWSEIERLQAAGCGIFVVVNEGGNSDAEITDVRAIFVDADGIPFPETWHTDPDFVVTRDEMHWHAYWRVDGLTVAVFNQAQRRLAAFYGTDAKVCNPSRIMRLAGTLHLKDPANPRLVTIQNRGLAGMRQADELLSGLPECPRRENTPQRPPEGFELDLPTAIYRATEYLRRAAPAIAGQGGNSRTFQLACDLYDLGLSTEKAIELTDPWNDRCIPPWEVGELRQIFVNAWRYHKNEPGAAAVKSASEAFAGTMIGLAAAGLNEKDEAAEPTGENRKNRFAEARRKPSEGASLPPLTYFDRDRILPHVPGGCTVTVIGAKSSHKTGLVMKKCLDAIEETDARVLYIATEGANGIETARLPAYREARGMSWEMLDAHWNTVAVRFNLASPSDHEDLIAAYRDFKPDIVVIDVLGKAAPGMDLNAPATGTLLMTMADDLAEAFNATVIIPMHPKRDGVEALGSIFFGALTFAEWHCTRERDQVKVWVEKMKDGKAEFAVHYGITWTAPGGVPIIREPTVTEISEARKRSDEPAIKAEVIAILQQAQHPDRMTEMAEQLAGNPKQVENWERRRDSERRQLTRLIGTDKKPGILAPLMKRDRHNNFEIPYLFLPISGQVPGAPGP